VAGQPPIAAQAGKFTIRVDAKLLIFASTNVWDRWKAVGLLLTTQAAIADVELLTAGRGRQAIRCQVI
jgi:hypothetical protein